MPQLRGVYNMRDVLTKNKFFNESFMNLDDSSCDIALWVYYKKIGRSVFYYYIYNRLNMIVLTFKTSIITN